MASFWERSKRKRREFLFVKIFIYRGIQRYIVMRWLRLVDFFTSYVSFAKEPYKRDDILPKRPMILRSLVIIAIPCAHRIIAIPYAHLL